jgi:hypothetical protein
MGENSYELQGQQNNGKEYYRIADSQKNNKILDWKTGEWAKGLQNDGQQRQRNGQKTSNLLN